jgi:hypothetical protein
MLSTHDSLGILFDREDRRGIFLRNVSDNLPDYMMSYSINSTIRLFLVFGIKCTLVYVDSVFSKEAFAFYKL